jgi:hypothetical protein
LTFGFRKGKFSDWVEEIFGIIKNHECCKRSWGSHITGKEVSEIEETTEQRKMAPIAMIKEM